MTDLSKFGFVEDTEASTQPTKNSQDLSKFGFVEDSNQPKTINNISQQPVPEAAGVGRIASGIAGLSNAGANIAETIGNAETWTLDKLGVINPKTKADIDSYINKSFKGLRTEANPNGDVFEQSLAKHPIIGSVAQAIPEVITTAGVGPGKTFTAAQDAGTLAKMGVSAANMGVQAAVNAPIAAGMIGGQDPQSQNIAAGITAAAGPIVSTLGTGLNWLGKSPLLKNKLGQLLDGTNKYLTNNESMTVNEKAGQSIANNYNKIDEAENAAWQTVKNIPGTINSKPLTQKLEVIKGIKNISEKQLGIINNIEDNVSNLTDMESAISLKQMLSANRKNFTKGQVSDRVYKQYMSLKDTVDNLISIKADEAGLPGAWQDANRIHSKLKVPLLDGGADDIAAVINKKVSDPNSYNQVEYNNTLKDLIAKKTKTVEDTRALLNTMDSDGSKIIENFKIKSILQDLQSNPLDFNKDKALTIINRTINKYDGTLSADSINTLKGIQKTLKTGGAMATTQNINRGGILQSIPGYQNIMLHIENMLDSPQGIAIFKGIGEGKPWARQIGQAIRLAPVAALNYNTQERPSDAN